jgi:hypothetical protein
MDEMEQAEDEFAQKAMVEAVENQIADGHPREAGMVMMALTKNGENGGCTGKPCGADHGWRDAV